MSQLTGYLQAEVGNLARYTRFSTTNFVQP